jgi:hypothetical protein
MTGREYLTIVPCEDPPTRFSDLETHNFDLLHTPNMVGLSDRKAGADQTRKQGRIKSVREQERLDTAIGRVCEERKRRAPVSGTAGLEIGLLHLAASLVGA